MGSQGPIVEHSSFTLWPDEGHHSWGDSMVTLYGDLAKGADPYHPLRVVFASDTLAVSAHLRLTGSGPFE